MEISEEELTKIVFYNEEKIKKIMKTLDEIHIQLFEFSKDFTRRCNANIYLFCTLQHHPCINITFDIFNDYFVEVDCMDRICRHFVKNGRKCHECDEMNRFFYHSSCVVEFSRQGHRKRFCQKCILSFHGFTDKSSDFVNSIKLKEDDVYNMFVKDLNKNFNVSKITSAKKFGRMFPHLKRLMKKIKKDEQYFQMFEKNRDNFPFLDDNMYKWDTVYVVDNEEPFVAILYCFEKRNINTFLA